MSRPLVFFFALFLCSAWGMNAQSDTLILNNGDVIVGEMKGMNRSVLTVETDYSDSDFKIEWEKVTEIHSGQFYTISLNDRTLLTHARIKTLSPGRIQISARQGILEVAITDVVYLRQLDLTFWSKMSAAVDIGYSLTKANNLQQYNANAKIGFKTDKWTIISTYRQVRSTQNDVEPIRRIEAGVNADYSLENGILFATGVNFLSNTEQDLVLRTTGALGVGYYIVRNNSWYWNSMVGVAINNEDYEERDTLPSADRQSLEGFVATEINLYDIGDLEVYTNVYWYPSFTETGRNRVDYKFDISYDLPYDFYIKAGFTLNYDSKPAPGSSSSDYVILTGFGWEL